MTVPAAPVERMVGSVTHAPVQPSANAGSAGRADGRVGDARPGATVGERRQRAALLAAS